jgi:ABC-type multidrug transport system fused ATPase/permease subunit
VLTDLDLTIPSGKVTAIVGPMGCGKSTLAHLLMRFYEPDRGEIAIAGRKIGGIPLKIFRTRAAIIFQESFLFSLSVRDNIAFADPSAELKRVKGAAATAMADEFIVKLKKRYRTLIGERGVNLSGGQKQRVAIARSLLNDPDILVMDSPTANIDAMTEQKLEKTLISSSSGRTSVIISQRIAPVKHADMIVVMDKGRIVGQGTHQELLEKCRLYRDIYQSQFI